LADALLEGEEEELVRKGIELAKAGDPQMLKFFLDRIERSRYRGVTARSREEPPA
jgi:hypothetical protein